MVLQSALVLAPAGQCLFHEVKHLQRTESAPFTLDAPLLLDDAALKVRNLQIPASRLVFDLCHTDYYAAEICSRT
jgi:hypothetical protein